MDWIVQVFSPDVWNVIIGIIVSAAVPLIAGLYWRVTGKELEAMHRAALQSALTSGVNWALVKLGITKPAEASDRMDEVAVLATDYVHTSVPDAVRYFNLDDMKIGQLATAKIPVTAVAPKPTVVK